jgi:hypothetical protein
MQLKDLEPFCDAPFYFRAKDSEGTYVWGNQRMSEYAGTELVGKTDYDITSAEAAKKLREDDQLVLETVEPHTFYEKVDDAEKGTVTLSVCKYPAELEGKLCVFGASFLVE